MKDVYSCKVVIKDIRGKNMIYWSADLDDNYTYIKNTTYNVALWKDTYDVHLFIHILKHTI